MGLEFSENTILSASQTTLDIARKDQEQLGTVGIDREYLDELESDIEAADALHSHEQNQGALGTITDAKNKLTELCYGWIRSVRSRMDRVFGVTSVEYARLPKSPARGKGRESIMIPAMEQAIQVAEEYHDKLQEVGQTDEDIEEGKELRTRLRAGDGKQELKKIENLSDTRIREEMFGSLYDRVNQINRVGRDLFADDPAKLARYQSPWP